MPVPARDSQAQQFRRTSFLARHSLFSEKILQKFSGFGSEHPGMNCHTVIQAGVFA
jgi:hypothetical protein